MWNSVPVCSMCRVPGLVYTEQRRQVMDLLIVITGRRRTAGDPGVFNAHAIVTFSIAVRIANL